jgi:hypothetical protein
MPPSPPRPLPAGFNSGGRTDSLSCAIPVDRAALAAWLARGPGLRLVSTDSALPHPVWIDVASIHEGRAELGGVDQHAWSALGYGALAATSAAAWGPLAWAAASATGAALGRSLSEWSARSLGTYDEVLVGIPDVLDPETGTPCTFVAGMITNSPVAVWGDRTLGCGYQKRLAPMTREAPARWQVGAGGELLVATFERADAPIAHLREAARRRLEAPLLGWLAPGRFARTRLVRDFDAPDVVLRGAHGTLQLGAAFPAGLGPATATVDALDDEGVWGAIWVSGVMTRVTWAEPVATGRSTRA